MACPLSLTSSELPKALTPTPAGRPWGPLVLLIEVKYHVVWPLGFQSNKLCASLPRFHPSPPSPPASSLPQITSQAEPFAILQMLPSLSCLWAFARAVPSTWNPLPLTLPHPSVLSGGSHITPSRKPPGSPNPGYVPLLCASVATPLFSPSGRGLTLVSCLSHQWTP